MNVSFGKQIPVSQCRILDKKINSFVWATLFEFDCKDISDIYYFKGDMRSWNYKSNLLKDMFFKRENLACYNSLSEIEKDAIIGNRYFALATEDDKLVGICETQGNGNQVDIFYLETEENHRYKYAGQSILASIAKQLINRFNNPAITVNYPSGKARRFYIDKCGFKQKDAVSLIMHKNDLVDFVDDFERKIQLPIIDFSV